MEEGKHFKVIFSSLQIFYLKYNHYCSVILQLEYFTGANMSSFLSKISFIYFLESAGEGGKKKYQCERET